MADTPMTEMEIKAWLCGLGTTRREQTAVIRDLLRHAGEDHMSAEDRAICRRCLDTLELTEKAA